MNTKTKRRTRFEKCFYTCPGAWTGNDPENGHPGLITVDVGKIETALKHVRRFYSIERTYIPESPPLSLRQAVYIQITAKPAKAKP